MLNQSQAQRVSVFADIERWSLKRPFHISGYRFDCAEVVVVTLEQDGHVGRGEASGVYYKDDKPIQILRQIRTVQSAIEAGLDRATLQELLPPGGARNALDCALWDLEAKRSGQPAFKVAGLDGVKPLLTTFTCGADLPEIMSATARSYRQDYAARAIKLKLTGNPIDEQRIVAVREALPEIWLAVDANQGFTPASLEKLMPVMTAAEVALIEQPFPVGQEYLLDGILSPIPIAADESVQTAKDIPALVGRFQVVNIKLDKCGGLTEGFLMVETARQLGLRTMVGNMTGTSLAMAPSLLIGQHCEIVDLDGPALLRNDRDPSVRYAGGFISCPAGLWG